MPIRIATFNCENLFARYDFKKNLPALGEDGFIINQLAFSINDDDAKKITARAIQAVDADILCVQEAESLPVLDRFNARYLPRLKYRHRILVDGNDDRQIDVGVLSRHPIVGMRSYRSVRNKANTAELFSRDCLVVDLDVAGKPLTLYVNHFKSMIGGRPATLPRRREQAEFVARLVDERWKSSKYAGNFIVLGDLNDYPGEGTSLNALLKHKGLVNILDRLPAGERWTHYYARGDEYHQLDYLLLSKGLAARNPGQPGVMRRGLPWRAEKVTEERLPDVGQNEPKASDHAPLFMDLELA